MFDFKIHVLGVRTLVSTKCSASGRSSTVVVNLKRHVLGVRLSVVTQGSESRRSLAVAFGLKIHVLRVWTIVPTKFCCDKKQLSGTVVVVQDCSLDRLLGDNKKLSGSC